MGKKIKNRKRQDNCAYLMLLPAYSVFVLFVLVPIGVVFFYSVTNFNLYTVPEFVGMKNYLNLFGDEDFIKSLINTAVYTVFTLFPQLAIGLLIAVFLYRKSKLVAIFRTAFYLPNVMSMVAVSMVWLSIFDPSFGLVNQTLRLFGISGEKWLQNPDTAMGCIIVMSIWKACGYSMVVFLSGLTSIPDSLYEAARLDGANGIKQFLHITWPMLKPTTFFLLVTGIVNSFAVFEQINIMTGGGPLNSTTTVVHQIYRRGFLEFKMGYASAMSVVLLIIAILITMLVFKFGSGNQDVDVS